MRLIGLAGKAGCGKDTVANYLTSRYDFNQLAFASALKAGICAMFNIDPDELEDREFKESILEPYGKSPRQMMQTLGTEWGRNCVHPELWLLLVEHDLGTYRRMDNVISDVRFENEADMIRKRGGKIWHIQRNFKSDVMSHASEIGIEIHSDDVIISNHGTIAELHDIVNFLIKDE